MAITDRVGSVRMNVYGGNGLSGWSTLGHHEMVRPDGVAVTPAAAVDVEADTLDAFCAREHLDRVRVCKVDVEGFEPNVFDGAAGMLAEHRIDLVVFEISDAPLRGQGRTPLDVFRCLTAHGYRIYRDGRGDPVVPEVESRELLARGAYLHNYFACPTHPRELCDPAQVRG